MKRSLARHVKLGESVRVVFEEIGKSVVGTVEEISPVVDAQSGTIKVKVRIDNPNGQILSGERCSVDIPISDQSSPQHSAAANIGVGNRRK